MSPLCLDQFPRFFHKATSKSEDKHELASLRELYYGNIPQTRTKTPYVRTSAVVAVQYCDGIMMAADTLACYGNIARFHTKRIVELNRKAMIAAGGELSDFQAIIRTLQKILKSEFCHNFGAESTAHELFSYLSRLMYQRRNKMDPLWNEVVIGGFDHDGNPILAYVDSIGTALHDNSIATGFGSYLALPILRERQSNDMSEEQAVKLLEDCLRICYYTHTRSSSQIQIGKITKSGTTISDPYLLSSKWKIMLE